MRVQVTNRSIHIKWLPYRFNPMQVSAMAGILSHWSCILSFPKHMEKFLDPTIQAKIHNYLRSNCKFSTDNDICDGLK